MELNYGQMSGNIAAWYNNEENMEMINYVARVFWAALQAINLGVLAVLWTAMQVGEYAYVAYVLIYFFPALLLTTYWVMQSSRHATLVECRRRALTDVHTI